MNDPVRVLRWQESDQGHLDDCSPEWLIGNGLGGYASGTVGGAIERRYHGILIAGLPAPFGRTVMLSLVVKHLHLPDGRRVLLGPRQGTAAEATDEAQQASLTQFRLEQGIPVWRYEALGAVIERTLATVHGRNTSILSWNMLRPPEGVDGEIQLELRPYLYIRSHDAPVQGDGCPYQFAAIGEHYEIRAGNSVPPLRLTVFNHHPTLTLSGGERREVEYHTEQRRGYDWRGTLWNPGCFRLSLSVDHPTSMIASSETWETINAIRVQDAIRDERSRRRALIERAHPSLQETPASELVIAADAFVIEAPRNEPAVADARSGHDVEMTPARTIIAGYHWFTDWGRDTMISLEGLTLLTGRPDEARSILHTFARHVRDGLIPNFFSEHEGTGVYHTADATLWFFHALDRYVEHTGDRDLVRELLPSLMEIVQYHWHGTRFGIGVDHADGLLRQGAPGYQLTWMDAKVDDWVVTPRRGKAVEINALWFNALKLLGNWAQELQAMDLQPKDTPSLAELADRAREAFNLRFWYAEGGYLYDVVDGEHGDDASCRPNQVFAISPRYPILEESRWRPVLQVVEEKLLTPVGLRSLSPGHPDYKPKYHGDLRARDAAYHQGTVWAWLIGPFVDAWIRLHPERRTEARRFLDGFDAHLSEAGVGSISEIFDADPPFAPRGCIAQAWSVAEVLRAWHATAA